MINNSQRLYILIESMKTNLALVLLLSLAATALAASNNTQNNTLFLTPVSVAPGKTIAFTDVWPVVDNLLLTEYWYYIRNATVVYEAGVNSPSEYLFFTIYRNIVGTFLVITTWDKTDQTTQINTFVRLGNGYDSSSGALYTPVTIDPFVITLDLSPGQFLVNVNANGTLNVSGGQFLAAKDTTGDASFNVTADISTKCGVASQLNLDTYWYYLDKAFLASHTHVPTNEQYYCVFIYVNVAGTFLSISHWDLASLQAGINTFVRLGDGVTDTANWGPVQLTPAVLSLSPFSN